MASKDIINPVDVNNPSTTRRSADLLPTYHRTDKNTKFLASTLDQFIQPAQLERVDGFLGSKLSPNYKPSSDQYIAGNTKLRTDYQLEPSLIISDVDRNISKATGYDDLINQLSFNNANVSNLDRLFRPSSYSYDPMIDWDKFVNFREYFWLPTGPDPIEITGQQVKTISTFSVTDSQDGNSLNFSTTGATTNPLITLYRGLTYVFNVNSEYPFYVKTAYVTGPQDLYSGTTNNGTKIGQVTVTIDEFTPNRLFYFAEGSPTAVGQFVIQSITEATVLDVDADIVGKKTYNSGNGVSFTNGMKVRFVGAVTPESYLDKEWMIEGVGSSITLTDYSTLQTVGIETTNLNVNFDATLFDEYPFDDFRFVPLIPEYVTINRAALDKNPWSRYNRWTHQDVIIATAKANGVPAVFDATKRATRPIIEFIAGLQLYDFGAVGKANVDLIDNVTTDAFKVVEKSSGFYIDGIALEAGNRVVFNADTDPLVQGKIYEVKINIIDNNPVINLDEVLDSTPLVHEAIIVTKGKKYAGSCWWFNGTVWQYGQQKTTLNQAPLWELYDADGVRYADQSVYKSSYKGTKLFGYEIGTVYDSVLGFNLSYRNVANVGEYLFDNYFMTDSFTNFVNGTVTTIYVKTGFLKVNSLTDSVYKTVWTKSVDKEIPIIQYQVVAEDTVAIEINAIDTPGYANDLVVDIFINDVKKVRNIDFIKTADNSRAYIVSTTSFSANDRVLFKLYTNRTPNANGYYETPINLTNNPLNGSIANFSFTELSDHVKTMVDYNDSFTGVFPGKSNLRDLPDLSSYGSRLVVHTNPISFAHYFLGGESNDDLITAIRKGGLDYNQFKSNLLRSITDLKISVRSSLDSASQQPGLYSAAQALDIALQSIASTKLNTANYKFSDMLAYGKNCVTRVYTVSDPRNIRYSLASIFDETVLSERSILVYLNTTLLVNGYDYKINKYDPSINISTKLTKGDVIYVLDYASTEGCYVPPTPTKLGLYPKFKPSIYLDNTYVNGARRVIQGHDGSITIAYNDYRDDILLEFETRIYNNLKISYNPELININKIMPGAFRTNEYSNAEITNLITADFLKWSGYFGVDYISNSTFDELNSFTFNYSGSIDTIGKNQLNGYWRGIYKYFYDTDRPHTHPWEMLGFTEQPTWWIETYGSAPYTSGNLILWEDLEAGRNANTGVINLVYARPGLNKIIPVSESGELLSPTDSGLASTPIVNLTDPKRVVMLRSDQIAAPWSIGDQSPAETAWRRSSWYPYAVQVMLALAKPADYSSLMFDPIRLKKNVAGEYKYTSGNTFLNPSAVVLPTDIIDNSRVLTSGYSVYIVEAGLAISENYLSTLKNDLKNIDYRLMAKLGSFASKDKLSVGIDAVDLASPYPGVLIPAEDYEIFFNKSAPIENLSVSGLIIQKTKNGYSIRGYDKFNPYFTILKPFESNTNQTIRVGGVSESFVTWNISTTYNIGQILFYSDRYYRVKQKHNSGTSFTLSYYQSLPYLPTVGGVAVLRRTSFDTFETVVPYGVEYATIQEVYDLIVGYGRWLESKGFVFDEYNNSLDQILDWSFTAKEFLYWTTQNWAVNAVITLSPFANKITFRSNIGIVDSIVNSFYEYSLLKADGAPFPKNNFTIIRLDGEFALTTINTQEGIFFARLNLTQKEHVIVMKNFTLFNDVIYDVQSGYRQRRIKIKGFITKDWNGDFFSPGFVFDQAVTSDWKKYVDYSIGDVVRFSGNYYAAIKSIAGTAEFDITQWAVLNEKPTPSLLPNFDYKINQFEDFYSLDIDNFDVGQQAMAQHLIGYTPRPYLNYIIGDPIAQYKFYQGFIRDKGSKRSLINLSKASINNLGGSVDFNEEWAIRVGYYGGYNTFQELEISLESIKFLENPQIIKFVKAIPASETGITYYKTEADVIVKPDLFDINSVFSTTSESVDDVFKLPVAGYVRFDDISATAYNKNSVLDIANNKNLKTGTTIWLGFREDGEWDVLRVTEIPTYISAIDISVPGQSLILSTYYAHQLLVGDLISVTGIASTVDQCYIVQEIVNANQFIVLSTLTALPSLHNPVTGLLFAFKSSRLSTFDNLSKIPFLDRWSFDEKVWVDNNGSNNWSVYKKTDNYSTAVHNSDVSTTGEHYATAMVSGTLIDGTEIVAVSAPDYYYPLADSHRGQVFMLFRDSYGVLQYADDFGLVGGSDDQFNNAFGNLETWYGYSLAFNTSTNLIVAGAPKTSNVGIVNTGTNLIKVGLGYSTKANQGVVKLSLWNTGTFKVDRPSIAITTPVAATSATFGWSIALSNNNSNTQKLVVGAPSFNSTNTQGAAYTFTVNATSTIAISTGTRLVYTANTTTNINFGWDVTGNKDLSRIAVAAPLYYTSTSTARGSVYVFNSSGTQIQLITGDTISMGEYDFFANKVRMSNDGQFLVVASPYAYDSSIGLRSGVVDIFTATNGMFVHSQRISAPISALTSSTTFGFDISLDEKAETLIISAVGQAKVNRPTFDKYTEASTITQYTNVSTSTERASNTSFDGNATSFADKINNAGTAHVYNRLGTGTTQFAHAQQLVNTSVRENSMFGSSVYATNNSVFVGAPAKLLDGTDGVITYSPTSKTTGTGQLFVFDKIDTTINSWALHRTQEPLVDITPLNRAITINTDTEQIQDYIDIIDPIKGNILGAASAELRYTSPYDPAIYSLGITGVNIDSNTNWLDEHVGDLWWDLSTVKYVWYEQGDLDYRKNNWNNIFPGSSIDVYEWVRSEYLPSEWAQLADSADGLTKGISGQPKFNNNGVISVKQVYNSVSNSFTNVYYYWVKNKSIVPTDVPNRKKAAFEVAQEIADPVGSGIKFMAVISQSALVLANSKSSIKSDQINLNIAYNFINDAANRHTEWTLIAENDARFNLPSNLIQKLIDSLLGRDSIGNLVPDPALPEKLKYGVQVRPKQSIFKDRKEALRNLVEFINTIILNEQLTSQIDFTNLNSVEEIPPSDTYDAIVEDIYNLELIPTINLVPATLTVEVNSNGEIFKVNITNPGFGYNTAPSIVVNDNGEGAELRANIDVVGSITSVDIISAGKNYTIGVTAVVRPYTAVVKTDESSAGKWAIYTWDKNKNVWIKFRTQSYNTPTFWKYVDWSSTDYNPLKIISTSIASPYALGVLQSLPVGSYVKVQNGGDGRYLIVRKTDGTSGTFDSFWDIVFAERGTIQLLDTLWSTSNTLFAWDQSVGFDQTSYDQSPDKELEYIILAVLTDIFVGSRYKYQNQLFFKAVRYALSEQKFLDWAFKTTFISAINNAGSLDQPSTYKLGNASYYEDFLKEAKPYHTKIRKFTEIYTTTELTRTFNTDFDLPVYYNTATLNFNKVEFGNNLLLQYPWKSWYNNYTYSVETIDIYDGGEGYTQSPTVTIVPAMGDNGHGATAVAYISLGKVNRIIVTNPGSGYSSTPTVILNGGGGKLTSVARVYAQLGNSPVRSNKVQLRFDRTTANREVGEQYFTQSFIADGSQATFELDWAPIAKKELITLTKNGILQLIDSFTIVYTKQNYVTQVNTAGDTIAEYTKLFATLKLNFVPATGDVFDITYPKSLDLYNAASRIQDYYKPSNGMPGFTVVNTTTNELDLAQLMKGVEYSGLQVIGLPFNSAGGWNAPGISWDQNPWDNFGIEDGYVSISTSSTATQTFSIPTLLSTGTQVNIYLRSEGDTSISGVRIDTTGTLTTSTPVKTLIGLGTGAVDRIEMIVPGTGYVRDYTSVNISAPNTLGGTQATVSFTTSTSGAISVNVVTPGSGYTETPTITIVEAINPNHSSTSVTVQAYARAILRAEFKEFGSTATTSTITIPDIAFTTTSTLVMLRYSTSDGTVLPTDLDSLDAVISGGDLAMTTALGLSPSEIILDGGSTSTRHITGMNDDGFLNPINSYAPEECVPGQIHEAMGISVYTQPTNSSPLITNRRYWVDGTKLTFDLGIRPANKNSVFVLFNNQKYASSNYTINYEANTFTFNSITPGTGWLSLTTMQLGTVQILDTLVANSTSSAKTVLTSSVSYSDVGSNYVTVNGIKLTEYTGTDTLPTGQYQLTSYRGAARVTVKQTGLIQVYLFKGTSKSFSEITEQFFTAPTTYQLSPLPGNAEPFHSQVIVTKNGLRLTPPVTTYYMVSSGQTIFDISKSIVYPSGRIDLANLEVYVNGTQVNNRKKWTLDQSNNQIIFNASILSAGDVVAIVIKQGYDYLITNGVLVFTTTPTVGDVISVTTFTNHDPDFIRTERFMATSAGQYAIQRPILHPAYVWVSYAGRPLSVNIDYTIGVDNRTVILRSGIFQNSSDVVLITSFADTDPMIAYRIFRDMLGRTHYKRLSQPNTTILTQDLLLTDTLIAVEDASVLTLPDPKSNRPGVVLIEGERIEFFVIDGNVLRQLRRSTLGTAPRDVYYASTPVIDYGTAQTIPVAEEIQKFTTATSTITNQVEFDLTGVIDFNTSTLFSNQVEVRYQGRVLLKPSITTYNHNPEKAFDSTTSLSTASVIDQLQPYEFSISSTGTLILNTSSGSVTLVDLARLEVTKRTSRVWYNNTTTTLSMNSTIQSKFLAGTPAAIPRYLSSSTYVKTDITVYLETLEELTDENNNPLEGI